MLAKKSRLTKNAEFEKIQREGKVFQSSSFGLAYINRNDAMPSRFGFVVSTKISKDSVDRNRFRRTLSEAVRLNSINLNPGFDAIFLAKVSISRVSTSEVMKEVKVSLQKCGILK